MINLAFDQLLALSAAAIVLGSGGLFCLLMVLSARHGDTTSGCLTAVVAGVCLVIVVVCVYLAAVPTTL